MPTLGELAKLIRTDRVQDLFGGEVGPGDYTIIVRVYGRDAVMGAARTQRGQGWA